jgi:hypothetical protein
MLIVVPFLPNIKNTVINVNMVNRLTYLVRAPKIAPDETIIAIKSLS